MALVHERVRLPNTYPKGTSYNVGGSESWFIYGDMLPMKTASASRNYGTDVRNQWYTNWSNEDIGTIVNQLKNQVKSQTNFTVVETNLLIDKDLNRFLKDHDDLRVDFRAGNGWLSDRLQNRPGWLVVPKQATVSSRPPFFTTNPLTTHSNRVRESYKNLSEFNGAVNDRSLVSQHLNNQHEYGVIVNNIGNGTSTLRGNSSRSGRRTDAVYYITEGGGHSYYTINVFGNLEVIDCGVFIGGFSDDQCVELNVWGNLTLRNTNAVSSHRGSSVVNVMDGAVLGLYNGSNIGGKGKYNVFGSGRIIRG